MRRELFESFYEGVIDKIAKQVAADNDGFVYVSNLNGVYEEYLNQKTALKYLIKNSSVTNHDDTAVLLDGHKVAACITGAITRVRLMTCSNTNDYEDDPFTLDKSNRLNEQVAILSGLSCLVEYMSADKKYLCFDRNDQSKTKIIFPETRYPKSSQYLDSLVRGLYYSNVISNINPLLLSHIFFMVEAYHRKCVEFEEFKASKS